MKHVLFEGIFDSESKLEKKYRVGLERLERINRVIEGVEDGLNALGDIDDEESAEGVSLRAQLEADLDEFEQARDKLEAELEALEQQIDQENLRNKDSVYSNDEDRELADDDSDDEDSNDADTDKNRQGSSHGNKGKEDNGTKEGEDGKTEGDSSKEGEDGKDGKDGKDPKLGASNRHGGGGTSDQSSGSENSSISDAAGGSNKASNNSNGSATGNDTDDTGAGGSAKNKSKKGKGNSTADGTEGEDGEDGADGEGDDEYDDKANDLEDDNDNTDPDDEDADEGEDEDDSNTLASSDHSGGRGGYGSGGGSSGEAVKLPFNMGPQKQQASSGGGGGSERDATFEELLAILRRLKGRDRLGAQDGIKKVIADRLASAATIDSGDTSDLSGTEASTTEALTEGILADSNSIIDVSPEAFSNAVNDALSRAIRAKGAIRTVPLAKRINISKLNDRDIQELAAENRAAQMTDPIFADQKEVERIKARRRANTRNAKPFRDFMKDLERVILDQIELVKQEYQTWQRPNRRVAGGAPEVRMGTETRTANQETIPILNIYVDQSGSWSEEDLKYSRSILREFAELQEDGLLEMNVLYFANFVHADPGAARAEGGTSALPDILDNIVNTKANNVVIITDDDLSRQGRDRMIDTHDNRHIVVDGGVWWLYDCTRLPDSWGPEHLRGKEFNGEYLIGM